MQVTLFKVRNKRYCEQQGFNRSSLLS